MADIKWLEGNRIQIAPPKRTKKITGTRFATILGLNPWSTAFEMWCAITKTYEKPFEDTIYTVAGKTIEPKQARYMEQSYGMDIVRPSDVWGEDYFNKTWGDFFPESKHLGGMWDYLMKGEDGKTIEAVLEMKTTKRAEDWQNDVPEYYALQAALYAYLYGVDDVIMVASFLDEKDYKDPAAYQPTASNTITVEFMLETQGVEAVLNFCQCNAFKYLYRAKRKNGLEDMKKAVWYLNKYIELKEGHNYDETTVGEMAGSQTE